LPEHFLTGIRKFNIIIAKTLNIVLLGKSGSGKTTFTRTLLNLDYVPEGHGFFSKTREPEIHTSVLEWKNDFYQLNIIDSPGLFESTQTPSENRSNDALMEMAMSCVDKSVTNVHCFAIVQRQDMTLSNENVATFKELSKIIPENIRNNCCLILTHCEKFDETKKKKKELELNEFEEVNEFTRGGIFFCWIA